MHTPGPWQIGIPQNFGRIAVHNGDMSRTLASVLPAPDFGVDARSNAALISAAPDLLEALRDLEVWLRSDESDPAWQELQERAACAGVADHASMVQLLSGQARVAIAKAEGRL